jgi:hypothetical protein
VEDTGSSSTGVVGHDRELELVGVVLEVEMGEGLGILVDMENTLLTHIALLWIH